MIMMTIDVPVCFQMEWGFTRKSGEGGMCLLVNSCLGCRSAEHFGIPDSSLIRSSQQQDWRGILTRNIHDIRLIINLLVHTQSHTQRVLEGHGSEALRTAQDALPAAQHWRELISVQTLPRSGV